METAFMTDLQKTEKVLLIKPVHTKPAILNKWALPRI